MADNQHDLCRKIESMKVEMGFETYIETIVWFHEHETDVEIEDISKHLNKKIVDHIQSEAIDNKMLKMDQPRDIFSALVKHPE